MVELAEEEEELVVVVGFEVLEEVGKVDVEVEVEVKVGIEDHSKRTQRKDCSLQTQ